MAGTELLQFCHDYFRAGQSQLAQYHKQRVAQCPSRVVECLDFADDRPFLEPSLFAYFQQSETDVSLEQLLIGYVDDPRHVPNVKAATRNGWAYLPQLGYRNSEGADSSVVMVDDHAERPPESWQPLRRVQGTEIEICRHADPLLHWVFQDAAQGQHAKQADVEYSLAYSDQNAATLDRAFRTLQATTPVLFDCLEKVTRRIVLFRSRQANSFASLNAHGTVFFNLMSPVDASEPFFIEDLAHQGGHVLFSSLTVERDRYLQVPAVTPLREFTGEASEQRDVFTALHGVFTEALMCIALAHCLQQNVFAGRQLHEVVGRLSFLMKRFHLDLLHVQHEGMFTELGEAVVRECGSIFDDAFQCWGDQLTNLDFSNQEYTFSFERFCLLNPEPRTLKLRF